MSDVLGKLSFLDVPDVNGINVLLEGEAITSATGAADQIVLSGSLSAPVVGIAPNAILPGTASLTIPTGTTAQRPASPTAGMIRLNTTLAELEYHDGTSWFTSGKLIQMVTGTIGSASSNSQIPYDNTTPLSTEGFQLWTQSFTPLRSDSTIIITTNAFWTVNSSADVYVSIATFQGTACIYAQLAGFTTNTGNGFGLTHMATVSAGSTAARTYSVRAGPQNNVTVFYNQGTGGQAYGSATNSGRYIIQEIAP